VNHKLKTWSGYFRAIQRGEKRFEVRFNDRNFKEGDTLELCEWDNIKKRFTDAPPLFVKVTYIMNGGKFGIEDGYVVMAIEPCRTCDHNANAAPAPEVCVIECPYCSGSGRTQIPGGGWGDCAYCNGIGKGRAKPVSVEQKGGEG